MILLSCQPDEKYFIWQLEVQLHNFKKVGINLSKVHMVFVSQKEMTEEYKKFYNDHPETNIFWYKDTRISKKYIPSLRPNGLKQHFEAFPYLEKEQIFYHDADIIFRQLPYFEKLCADDIWYLSDTNSYINSEYIKSKGEGILQEMCSIVGIKPSVVESIVNDSGGAQYLMKNIDSAFWEKVENDCERLYAYMVNSIPYWAKKFAEKSGLNENQYHPIQAWTADMWCVLWNGLIRGNKVKITKELEFSWATDTMHAFNTRNIFHNAGVTEGDKNRLFYKGAFIHESPFDKDLSYVDSNFASSAYVNEIKDYVKSKEN